MTFETVKDCKKCVIQNIINPGKYLMVECENEEYYKKKLQRFESLLAGDVEKYTGNEEIQIGQVVAFRDEKGFHRGAVIDIFNRNFTTIYWISLIDCGKMVETDEKNIYLIKTQTLKDQVTNVFEISLHDVQPSALDINYRQAASEGIFQLRKCDKWCSGAFKFVRSLFLDDPYVFVRIIKCDKKRVSGDIYYFQESDWKIASLSQKLFDEGFAVLCSDAIKSSECGKKIVEKIPENALLSDSKLCNTLGSESIENISISEGRSSCTNETTTTPKMPCLVSQVKSDPSSSTNNTVFENKNLTNRLTITCDSNANKLSICSVLKNNPVSSCSNSVNILNQENTNDSNECNKLNISRIVMRNLNFYSKQKCISSQN